jgi:hypothetical protein
LGEEIEAAKAAAPTLIARIAAVGCLVFVHPLAGGDRGRRRGAVIVLASIFAPLISPQNPFNPASSI